MHVMTTETRTRPIQHAGRTIVSRIVAALLGGYALATALSIALAGLIPGPRADDAVLSATLASFAVYAAATWSVEWAGKLASFIQAQHALDQSFDDPAKEFKGYTLVDAALNYKLPKGELRLGVANLFDKDYITYYSQSALVEPKRYSAGWGRTVTLGYSLGF